MDENEIIACNKLIAEFMGGIYETNPADLKPYSDRIVIDGKEYKTKPDKITHNYLKYDCSWNWLMPVVEKIETLTMANWNIVSFKTQISKNSFVIFSEYKDSVDGIIYQTDPFTKPSKLEATYNGVVEFIKWYNQNN